MMPASPRKFVGGNVFGSARALGTQGYRCAAMRLGPARTARKHCHRQILTPPSSIPSSNLPPNLPALKRLTV